MTIFYDSNTGNVKRFTEAIEKYIAEEPELDSKHFVFVPVGELTEADLYRTPYALITRTTKFGQVPDTTSDFLNRINQGFLRVVASSGNRNWGQNYGKAADLIKANSRFIEHSMKFELSGLKEDVIEFINLLRKSISSHNTVHIYP